MGNHDVPCDFCREDTRGLGGVRGCDTQSEAEKCYNFSATAAKARRPLPSTRESDERLLAALRLRDVGRPYDEIARRLGYKTTSVVRGLISRVRAEDRKAENA